MSITKNKPMWLMFILVFILAIAAMTPGLAGAQDDEGDEDLQAELLAQAQEAEGPIARFATNFIGVFQTGGDVFVSLVTGIVPLLIILLTAVNALITLIGAERIEGVGELAARQGLIYYPIRYIILPFLAVFFLTNPMAYTMGRFLPEKKKPAFYDAAVSFVHPPLGLFPHVNAGEYFVWGGIAVGITQLGLPLGTLAVWYLITGLIVIFIRGIVTEIITNIMWPKEDSEAA